MKKQGRKMSKADQLTAATALVEELTAEIGRLRRQVRTLEVDVATWRRKAEKHRSRAKKLRATAEKALAEAAQAARKRTKQKTKAAERQVIADHPRAEPLALRDAPGLPEASWTLVQLRAAAKEQGVTGYSRMRKEQLLEALI